MMCIILFFLLFIHMLNSIIGVEMFYVIGGDGISGFPSSFWWYVTRHEERGEAQVSIFCAVRIDERSVNDLICGSGRFV